MARKKQGRYRREPSRKGVNVSKVKKVEGVSLGEKSQGASKDRSHQLPDPQQKVKV